MSSAWPLRRLGDVVACLDANRRPVKASDRRSGPYPYYGASGIIDHVSGYLFEGTYALVAEDGENLRSRNTPIAFLATGRVWVNNHAHILDGGSETDVRFLAHAIENSDVSGYLTGSTQPKLTQESLLSMRMPWPSLGEQQAIAEVLGTFDDRIDANQVTINQAEDVAKTVPRSISETRPLGAVAAISHKIVSTTVFADRDVEHFSIPAFDATRLPIVESGNAIKSGKFLLEEAAVLVSKLNPQTPRVWMATPSGGLLAITSTEFLAVHPVSGVPVEVLWALCSSPDFSSRLVEKVKGTTGSHQRVSAEDVLAVDVPDPLSLTDAASRTIGAAVQLAGALRRESAHLSALRRALVPRLLSGEVSVSHLEPFVEAAV